MQSLRLLCLGLLIAGASCQQSPYDSTAETQVPEGINDAFTDPDMKVEEFVDRFESPKREVFHQRDEILKRVGLQAGMAVADIGAGTGAFTFAMADQVGPQGRVDAVEISPAFLKRLQSLAESGGYANVKTVRAQDRSCGLPPESIDVAFLCDVYHHFEYPEETVASLYRALRPGGSLVLVDFHRIEGVSSPWIMNHVRAGKEVFQAEIESQGFEFAEEEGGFLETSYFLRFRRP